MGWKDGCPSCGGHRNAGDVILHRAGCGLGPEGESPWAGIARAKEDSFYVGLIHTLVVHELLIAYSNYQANKDTIMMVLQKVLSRFPDAEVSAEVYDTILSRVEREVIHGGSDIPAPPA